MPTESVLQRVQHRASNKIHPSPRSRRSGRRGAEKPPDPDKTNKMNSSRVHILLYPRAEPPQLVHRPRVHVLAKLELPGGLHLRLVDVGVPPARATRTGKRSQGSVKSVSPTGGCTKPARASCPSTKPSLTGPGESIRRGRALASARPGTETGCSGENQRQISRSKAAGRDVWKISDCCQSSKPESSSKMEHSCRVRRVSA